MGPESKKGRPVPCQAAWRAPGFGTLLQHVGRLPAHAAGSIAGQCRGFRRARHWRHQAEGGPAGRRARHQARGRGARAPGRRGAGHGRCQPAMGSPDGAADVPHLRVVQPGVDRGAARCLRPRGPCRAGDAVRYPDRDRRNADERRGALGPDPSPSRRLPDAGCAAGRGHHAVPQGGRVGGACGSDDRTAFCDGAACAPCRRLSARAVGRAF
ncbi:hypothetical protein D3C72_1464080 [compost metagenome]